MPENVGLCQCGCGLPAPIAQRNRYAIGHIKGKPLRFIDGHQLRPVHQESRQRTAAEIAAQPASDGLCGCGCGLPTPIANQTNRRRGSIKGYPQKFIRGHATTRKERTECAADECGTLGTAKYCQKHATRFARHGDLTGKRPQGSAEERYWRYVTKTDGCWIWGGSVADTGYGVHWTDEKRLVGAHRYSYELHRGPIPDGLPVDHRCHNLDPTCRELAQCPHRRCVNPDHLEPVTQAENMRRARERTLEPAVREAS